MSCLTSARRAFAAAFSCCLRFNSWSRAFLAAWALMAASFSGEIGGGWCVPWSGYPAALTAATGEGPEKLRARGAVARSWVLREYSWEKPARSLIDFYEGFQLTHCIPPWTMGCLMPTSLVSFV